MAAVSLSVSTVKPLGDRVFVKVSESEEKTAGGILLPDTAKEKPQVGEVAQVDLVNATRMVLVNLLKLVLETKFSTVSMQVLISNLAAMNMFFYLRKTS